MGHLQARPTRAEKVIAVGGNVSAEAAVVLRNKAERQEVGLWLTCSDRPSADAPGWRSRWSPSGGSQRHASIGLPNRASGAFLHSVRAGTIHSSELDVQVTGSADRGEPGVGE